MRNLNVPEKISHQFVNWFEMTAGKAGFSCRGGPAPTRRLRIDGGYAMILSEINREGSPVGTFNSLEEARDYMRGDTFAMSCGMHLDELTDEYSVCSMEVTGEHLNVHGTVMGGAIFTLADFAFGCLAAQIT